MENTPNIDAQTQFGNQENGSVGDHSGIMTRNQKGVESI